MMMKSKALLQMKSALILIAFLVVLNEAGAQKTLSIDDAFISALENNLNIKVAENQTQIAANNATKGNAGALPTLSAGGSYSGSLTNTLLVFAGNAQPPIEVDGAQSATLAGNVTANYVLFNGFRAANSYEKLKTQESLAQIQEQVQIESVVLAVANAYYVTLQIQNNLQAAESSLLISQRRLDRAKLRVEYGSANKIALLNAEVDLRNDSINVLTLKQQLLNAKNNLSYLIGQAGDSDFDIEKPFDLSLDLGRDELFEIAMKQNTSLLQARQNLLLNENDIDISKSTLFPSLSLSTSYQYNSNQSDANFVIENRSAGLNGGISLNYSLFNGGAAKIQRQNAQFWQSNHQLYCNRGGSIYSVRQYRNSLPIKFQLHQLRFLQLR